MTSPRCQSGGLRGPLLTQGASGALLAVLIAPALAAFALAQTVEVTAALDLTDGYARPGAYVPVRLKAMNRTHSTVAELRLSSGGPVDVVTPWPLAPGEAGEKVVPVLFVGADLRLSLVFRDASGRIAAEAAPAALLPRTIAEHAALISLDPGAPEPDAAFQERLCRALRAQSLCFVRQVAEAYDLSARCGVLDGRVQYPAVPGTMPAAVFLRPFPAGTDAPVQPEVSRLLASRVWPAEDRLRLWLWLAVFTLAALAAGAVLPRRRAVLAAAGLVALAAAAVWFIGSFGEVRAAEVREARIFYIGPDRAQTVLEHLALLASRGGAAAEFPLEKPGRTPLPLPLLTASEDLFRPVATLHLADREWLVGRTGQTLVHVLERAEPPPGIPSEKGMLPDLATVAKRADVLAALSVDGDRAADAAGRSQSIEAWAAEWQAGANPDLAYAGRSLAWWDRTRREGTGPAILIWRRGPALPSLVIYACE